MYTFRVHLAQSSDGKWDAWVEAPSQRHQRLEAVHRRAHPADALNAILIGLGELFAVDVDCINLIVEVGRLEPR